MKDHIEELLEILFDKSAREDERHDAAMYLYEYDDPRILNAFLKIGADKNELSILREAAGEGIGEIWCRTNKSNLDQLKELTNISRDVAIDIIKRKNPGLINI